jgi:two-component system, NarL family, response regulator LiaR
VERISVAVANDFELVVAGLAKMLEPFRTVLELVDFVTLEANELPPELPAVDVLLFDTFGRVGLGIEAVERIVRDRRAGHVVVYTWETRRHLVERAMAAGASACVSKALTSQQLVDVLLRVAGGERIVEIHGPPRAAARTVELPGASWGLTERESEVLALASLGQRNREIADALFVSADTVKTHLRSAYRKLGVRNRTEAVGLVLADGSFALHPDDHR